MADERPLILLDQPAFLVEDRERRNGQPGLRS